MPWLNLGSRYEVVQDKSLPALAKRPSSQSSSWCATLLSNTLSWWDHNTRWLWAAMQVQTSPTCSPIPAGLQRDLRAGRKLSSIRQCLKTPTVKLRAFGNLGNLLLSIASNPRQRKRSSGDELHLQTLMGKEFHLCWNQDKTWAYRGWKSTQDVSAAFQGTALLLWGSLSDTLTLTLLIHPSPQRCEWNVHWESWVEQRPENPPWFGTGVSSGTEM